jgi:hypothetical protein
VPVEPTPPLTLLAPAAGSTAAGLTPIWRSSWRAMASARPPGRPVICVAYCWSSMPVAMLPALLSLAPSAMVLARMLFISSCMNRASNCLATSLIAPFGSLPAAARRPSSVPPPAARRWLAICVVARVAGPVERRLGACMIRSPRAPH